MIRYGEQQNYRHTMDQRYDPAHHLSLNPTSHMHDFYRPKAQMPYTRPEDGHAAARLSDTAEAKLTSPFAKYRDARILYSNVSGV